MCLWIPGITQHLLQLRINWFLDRKGLFSTHWSCCKNVALLTLQQNHCFYYQCLFLFVADSTLTTRHWSVVNTKASENWTRYQNPSGGQREAEKKRKRESDRQNDMKSEATAAPVTLLSCLILVSPDRLTAEQETRQIHTRGHRKHTEKH